MDEFVSSLKEIYGERLLQSEEQWPPVRGDKLMNLQLVEADKTEGFSGNSFSNNKVKHTPILHSNVFKTDSSKKPVRKIIIEGNGGMGKTTLCTMLAEEWAEGKILTQFDCILLLPLRDSRVSSATSLSELFKPLHANEKVRAAVVDEIGNGKGILVIADGWDELDEDKRSKQSFLYNFLFGGLLPLISILVTSRPSASAPLHKLKCVHRLIEIVGFNKENIEQYIQSEFSDSKEKSSSLIEELENNPLIQSVCSVPLNCAIVCHLWHTLNQSLPTTLTELYTQIVLNIIYRNISKNFPECDIGLSLTSFDSIPQYLQESFWLTCKFAFDCLCHDQIVFSEDELTSFFPEFLSSNIKFQCFGLLQSAQSLMPAGVNLSFHFIHLTIQEFLGALHLATLSNDRKLEFAKDHANSSQFDMMWRFVFGLGTKRMYSFGTSIVDLNIEVVQKVISDFYVVYHLKKFCHLALESFSESLTTENNLANAVTMCAVEAIDGDARLFCGTSDNVTAVLHVLRHTKHCLYVKVNFNGCGMNNKQLKSLTDIVSNWNASNLQLIELDLSNNCFSNERVVRLLEIASPVLSSLGNLFLFGCNIVNIPPQILSRIANTLTHLSLSNNPLGVSGIQSLETAVQDGALGRLRFLYLSNTLTNDVDINGALLTTFLPSLASHCPHLRRCNLSKNILGVPGACAVGEAIHLFCEFIFVLNDISIDLDAIVSFCTCAIASQNFFFLSNAFVSISFDNNPIGFDSLLSIFLLFNKSNLRIQSVKNIALATVSNTAVNLNIHKRSTDLLTLCPVVLGYNITEFDLSNNNLSGPNIVILAECIRVCQSLNELCCTNCNLTASDFIELLFRLKSSGTIHMFLKQFELCDNFIDNDGANKLIKNLCLISEVFPVLVYLDITSNMMDSEIKTKLNSSWEVSYICSY